MRIAVKPFGPVDPAALEHLRTSLREFGDVDAIQEASLPAKAFDAKRGKYRASAVLRACLAEPGDRILAVTDVDLFEEGKTFVFGYATIRDRFAVISPRRLHDGSAVRFLDRVEKEAFHEIGHTLGLDHDPDPGCVMHFSNSLQDTDRKGRRWCAGCAAVAEPTLRRLGR